MDGWYYSQNGQSVGPVALDDLKRLVASGQVGRDELVWHDSLADWTAAKRVPGLVAPRQQAALPAAAAPAAAAPAARAAAAPRVAQPVAASTAVEAPPVSHAQTDYFQPQQQAPLGYQGTSTGDIMVTARTLNFLRQTRPWVMFIAVLLFLGAALCCLGAIAMLAMPSMLSGGRSRSPFGSGIGAFLAILYFVFAFLYFLLGFQLTKYFGAIGSLLSRRSEMDLESAMGAQLQFWRIVGMGAICGIGLYLILIVVAFLDVM